MRALLSLAFFIVCCSALAEALAGNRLQDHPSPYLAMHGDDPVVWQVWDAASFERARKEHKPVFVSSGYFSCHWCHVMQRESYRDATIAAYINRHFIPIKIDRELLPDVDAALIDFAKYTRGQAGWPLNVFLTPEGYPLVAALYLPSQNFQTLLTNIQTGWATKAETLTRMAMERAKIASAEAMQQPAMTTTDLSQLYVDQALAQADELSGGFGAQSKFPMVPQLWALFDAYADRPDSRLAKFLRLTLEQMASQGLRDHLDGGFFRYTVDPTWQTPHFEKMLYDNAQSIRLYLRAAVLFKEPAFANIARETLDFVLGNMHAPGGGFYAAFSAVDGNGIEGGYYLWDAVEVERLAGDDWPLLRHYWGLQAGAAFEAGHLLIPHQTLERAADDFKLSEDQALHRITQANKRLLDRRSQRSLPIDAKILAGWNGLMLTALVEAARYFEPTARNGRYTQEARELQAFIRRHFVVNDRLLRMRNDSVSVPAGLEDYAYVIEGLEMWQTAFGRSTDQQLLKLTDSAWSRFYVDTRWYQGGDSLLRWRGGEPAIADGAMPSPAAVLMRATTHRTDRVLTASRAAYPAVARQPFQHASYVGLYDSSRAGD